jgi:hypothetical protein
MKWPISSAPSPPSTAPSSSSASATASADPSLVTDSPRLAKKLKPAELKPPAGASARFQPAVVSPASTTPALRKKGADVRWREFSLDHPQQEINGRTVNFPVGAGPIESAVLADLDDANIDLVLESLVEDEEKMDGRARKDGGTVNQYVEPVLHGLLRLGSSCYIEANTRIICDDFLQKRRLRLRRVQTPQAERGSLL